MTKDELKKEAEEKLPQAELDYCHGFMNPCEPSELPYIELVRFRTGFERGYFASAEPREKRIAELEEANTDLKQSLDWANERESEDVKRIAELEKENKVLAQNLEDTEILNNTYEKRFDNLKKENAELKVENSRIKTCSNCDEYVIGRCCNYPNGVCHHWKLSEKYRNDDELTTAKEIIKLLLWDIRNRSYEPVKDVERAEQFLNENSTYERIQKAKYNYTN